ncbi:hypothetical protein [Flavobacterium sp.]|uniref:hypothetical protein n=1 Tax=Flavobacterium sp. TaxID=239 RepID=UPI00286E38C9|nr:hypothetical protein [Flavobacterium sp.]
MSYYESYLDEDLLNEDLLNEDLLESYGESFDESRSNRRPFARRINPSVSPGVRQRSNFGGNLSGNSADYATKSDLKKSLDTISKDVNELKTTTIATNKALVSLDAKHTQLAKIDLQKNDNQTKVLKNMQMMNMMGSLLNQPKLKVENLQINPAKAAEGGNPAVPATIGVVQGKNPIEVDMTMSLLLPMLTTMGDSGSGKSSDSMNMMLPLVLIMGQGGSNNDSSKMLPLVLMMTMMNK